MDVDIEAGAMRAKTYQAAMGTEAYVDLSHKGLFSGLETKWNLPWWISYLLATDDPFIPSTFLSFGMGMSILYLSHHCILYVIF